jgi:hypothetical protein
MKVEINIPPYSPEDGVQLEWDDNFIIITTSDYNTIYIKANQAGLISIARHLLTLAQSNVPTGHLIHFDDAISMEFVIEKIAEGFTKQHVPDAIRAETLAQWQQRIPIADLLRYLYENNPNSRSPGHLMFSCAEIFGGWWSDYNIIGGWWIDGTGSIDDATLEERLAPDIEKLVPRA